VMRSLAFSRYDARVDRIRATAGDAITGTTGCDVLGLHVFYGPLPRYRVDVRRSPSLAAAVAVGCWIWREGVGVHVLEDGAELKCSLSARQFGQEALVAHAAAPTEISSRLAICSSDSPRIRACRHAVFLKMRIAKANDGLRFPFKIMLA